MSSSYSILSSIRPRCYLFENASIAVCLYKSGRHGHSDTYDAPDMVPFQLFSDIYF